MPLTSALGNGGSSPSPELWNRANVIDGLMHRRGYEFFDDFRAFTANEAVASNVGTYSSPMGAWRSFEGASAAIAQLATEPSGVVQLATAATDDIEAALMPGSATSVGFKPDTAANGGLSLFFECRMQVDQVASGNVFIGLTEPNLNVTDGLITDANALVDKDFIGFFLPHGDPSKIDFVYRKENGTLQTPAADLAVLTADTWYKFGFLIDMEESDSTRRIKLFVDGVEQGSYVSQADFEDATNFPAAQNLHVHLLAKAGAATAKKLRVDWVRVYQERY